MKDYQYIDSPKSLIGKYFETRDSKFYDRKFRISHAHWAADNKEELCVWGSPDGLSMLYTLLPNKEGKYNLERISDKE